MEHSPVILAKGIIDGSWDNCESDQTCMIVLMNINLVRGESEKEKMLSPLKKNPQYIYCKCHIKLFHLPLPKD